MSAPLAADPFGASSGAAGYVPRRATEEALERLVRGVLEEGRVAVVQGPGGMGKTVLLRRLAEMAGERFRPLYLPFAALSPEDLSHWVLSALELGPAPDPVAALAADLAGRAGSGVPLLLLVDDATALPLDTARWLGELCQASSGGLRLALAALEGPSAAGLVAALDHGLEVVPLTSPMSREETRAYLTARLARASAPKARRALFDETFERLHLVARGNPRRLHFAADAVMRGEPPESIDAVLGEEQPVRAPRRSGLSALIRPSAPNRAGTFRFAHEALRPPREAPAGHEAPAGREAPAEREVRVERGVPVEEPARAALRESEPAAAPVPEAAAAEELVAAAAEQSAPAEPQSAPAAVMPAAHPDTEITPEDLAEEPRPNGARAFLSAFLRRDRVTRATETPAPPPEAAALAAPVGEAGADAAAPERLVPPAAADGELPWARPLAPSPAWRAAASRRVRGAILVTAARALRASGTWLASRRRSAASANPYLGHVRVRTPRAPMPWGRGIENLVAGCAALALLGLAIVYLAPPLAEASREFFAQGVTAAGDGFEWVAEAVEHDFSSAREVAVGDFPSADEMVRAKLSAAAEALLHVPERLLARPQEDGSAGPAEAASPGLSGAERGAALPGVRRPSPLLDPRRVLPGWPNVVRIGINASPWAEVSVDGFHIGETPIAGFPLLAGTYRFRATFPDGSSVEREIEVGPETQSIVFP